MDLNDTTAEELERTGQLDGISARYLVEHRALIGRFDSWEQVDRVPNLGEGTAQRLQSAGFEIRPAS